MLVGVRGLLLLRSLHDRSFDFSTACLDLIFGNPERLLRPCACFRSRHLTYSATCRHKQSMHSRFPVLATTCAHAMCADNSLCCLFSCNAAVWLHM
jgi:hypothetical protein